MMLSSIENSLYYILPKRSIIVCIPRSISYYYFFFFSDEMERLKFELRQSKIKEAAESEKCSEALSERHRMEEQLNTQVFKARDYFEKYKTLKKTMELNQVIIENTSCLDCKDQRKENQILKTIIEQRAIIKLDKLKKNINSVSPAPIINKTQEQIVKNQNEILAVMKCTQCSFKGKNAIVIKKHLVEFHETENIGTDWEKFYRAHYNIEIVICPFCKEMFQSQIELNRHSKLHESHDTKLENMSKLIQNLSDKIDKPCNNCDQYKEQIEALRNQENTDKENQKEEMQIQFVETEEVFQQNNNSDVGEIDNISTNDFVDSDGEKKIDQTEDNNIEFKFLCEKCEYKCNDKSNYNRHIDRKHGDRKHGDRKQGDKKKTFKCIECPTKEFKTKQYLKTHTTEVHGDKIYKCNYCNSKFVEKYKLTYHTKTIHKK